MTVDRRARARPAPPASATSSCSTPTPTRCPKILREESPRFLGDEDLPIERYISREWHELEKAAAVDAGVAVRLPRGAHPPRRRLHGLRHRRALVRRHARRAPDTIKAYPNACLHRGRQLKQYDGNCSEIRCPFHGFAWNLDGSLQGRPRGSGTSRTSPTSASTFPRSRSARGTGSCSSTPTPTPSRSRTSSGSWPPTSTAGTSRDRYVQAHVAQGHPGQLEDRPGGVLRGVPRQRHAPADPPVHRRHQQPGRHLGQLQPGDHAGGDAEPAARLGARRRDDPALRARRAPRRGAVPHRQGRRDRPLGDGRRHPRQVAARSSASSSTSGATPRWSTTSTTRCSPTSTRGARSTASSTASARTATTTGRRSWRSCSSPRSRASGRRRAPVHHLGVRRAVDRRPRARRARQGVRAGHVQHGPRAAGPGDARTSRASRWPTTRRARCAGST